MGIALLTLSGLFQGFTAIQRKPLPAQARALRTAKPAATLQAPSPQTIHPSCTSRPAALRVVRERDPQAPSSEIGRMVISGRMADVCAELERMVAREAAQQARPTRH